MNQDNTQVTVVFLYLNPQRTSKMKLLVTGGRNYTVTNADYSFLAELHRRRPITELISGGARGVDTAIEKWARIHNIPVHRLLPNWNEGKGAGYINNMRMAAYADAVAAFPGAKEPST